MMDCVTGGGCMMGMRVVWLFWIALIAFVAWGLSRLLATRRGGTTPADEPPRETLREVLDRRYAHGEISTAEYEERRRKLGE